MHYGNTRGRRRKEQKQYLINNKTDFFIKKLNYINYINLIIN